MKRQSENKECEHKTIKVIDFFTGLKIEACEDCHKIIKENGNPKELPSP